MYDKSVSIIVLGDIGRSPRMQYHALSFSKMNFNVNLIGYDGTKPLPKIQADPNIKIIPFREFPNLNIPQLFNLLLKTLWQAVLLLNILIFKQKSKIIFVQNPPAIPTIPICVLYCFIFRKIFIIDWHNYAHTVMALSLSNRHPLTRVTKTLETFFGYYANYNFCVTEAMQKDLKNNFKIDAAVFYDRPSDMFRPIDIKEEHNLFLKLGSTSYKGFKINEKETLFTKECENEIILKPDRPGLLVSSTSWTKDEDFSVLLEAFKEYDESTNENLAKLICVITGRGPLLSYYENEISSRKWKRIVILPIWLESNDYPLLLASADLGVSLHTSTSGLDLPMKVVDMFGCLLPVAAFNFQCLNELVKDNENGYIFNNVEELKQILYKRFDRFPNNDEIKKNHEKFKKALEIFRENNWDVNWNEVVRPIVEKNFL